MNIYRVPKINSIHIVGNLTNEPKFHVARTTNAMVANFRIAWSEKYKIRNNDIRERACYVNVSAWLKLAELCKRYLRKGDKVYVEGKLVTWNDHDEHGQLKSGLEILANKIDFLTIKNQDSNVPPEVPEAAETDPIVHGGVEPESLAENEQQQ
jgi:single-strand DNA-binding protein